MKVLVFATLLLVWALLSACGGSRTEGEGRAAGGTPESSSKAAEGTPAERDDEREAGGEKEHVTLSPEVQQRLGIGVAAVQKASLAVGLRVTGSVQPIESRVARVRPLARGRIVEVVARVGDRVARGALLARFDNIEAGELAAQRESAQAELGKLRVQLATATRQAERSARLAEIGAVPRREHDVNVTEQQAIDASIRAQESSIAGIEARLTRFGVTSLAERIPSTVSITSPIAGFVIRAGTGTGDVVDSSTELFALVDMTRVHVQANLFEKDLSRVHEGQDATVRVDAYPDLRLPGKVVAVAGALDPRARTVPVRVEVDNRDARLRLDMFASVDLATDVTESGLAVPRDAVQSLDGRSIVFVKADDTEFAVRTVETGRLAGRLIEITRGLSAGDSVVTAGAFRLKSALMAGELGDDDDDAKERER